MHHLRCVVLLIVALLAPLCAGDADDVKRYHDLGRAIVDQVNAGKLDVATVEANVLGQVRIAVAMARRYAERHPTGKRMLDTAISQAAAVDAQGAVTGLGPMKDMAFATIEGDWHDLGHFKTTPADAGGLDLANEDNEHFTDPLHAIVHPLMVLAAAKAWAKEPKAEHLAAAKAEMEEGIEQIEKTAKALR